jgi:hypothetical protein
VTAVTVFVYSLLGAAVYAAVGLGVCTIALHRFYNMVDYITISAACAGAVVGAVCGAAQLITAAVRARAKPVPVGEQV